MNIDVQITSILILNCLTSYLKYAHAQCVIYATNFYLFLILDLINTFFQSKHVWRQFNNSNTKIGLSVFFFNFKCM